MRGILKTCLARALPGALAAAGCGGLAARAPVVDDALAASADAGIDRATLERGRLTYLRDCGRCHTPVALSTRDEAGWAAILPKMYEKAYLSREESEDLAAYVLTASRSAQER